MRLCLMTAQHSISRVYCRKSSQERLKSFPKERALWHYIGKYEPVAMAKAGYFFPATTLTIGFYLSPA